MWFRFLLCLFLLIQNPIWAQSSFEIVLSNEMVGVSNGEGVGFFEDVSGAYTDFKKFKEVPDTAFEISENEILDFDFTNSRFWVKFTLNNQSDYSHFFLEAGRSITNEVEFYEVEKGRVIRHLKSGDDYTYETKKVRHRKNLFPFDCKVGQEKTIYLMFKSDGELLFSPLIFHDRETFFQDDFKVQFQNGFYYGLIALVVIIYFFFFVFLRDKTFLFYIFYVFSQGALQFSLDGYSHYHFFPSGGYFTNHILLFFAGLTVVFLLLYVNHFLQIKEKSKLLWHILFISRITIGIVILLSLFPGILYEISYPIINGASLFGILLAMYCIIHLGLKHGKVDFFFASAFIVLIIGGVVFIFSNLGIVGDKIISLKVLKISSALEFVILSVSMSNKYGKLQKEKEVAQKLALKNLEEKNTIMDESNVRLEKQVLARTAEISAQKEEILSSIKYAQRIQDAIFRSNEDILKLLPNSFVYYRPKEAVSGDFYFVENKKGSMKEKERYTIFAAVDCTGHGVPGAFMSIVGNNLLMETLTERNVNSPAEALSYLDEGINKTFRRSIEGVVLRDGMDIAMCVLNENKTKLQYAGAKNPLYLIRSKEQVEGEKEKNVGLIEIAENEIAILFQIKGERHSIGNSSSDEKKLFKNHEVDLKKGDQLFVFSDGFADQFGGVKGKKYNYKQFRKFLLSIYTEKTEKQKELFEKEFNRWLGNEDQIDDVLVMGVKI